VVPLELVQHFQKTTNTGEFEVQGAIAKGEVQTCVIDNDVFILVDSVHAEG